MPHFVNGIFFQQRSDLGVGFDDHGEKRAVIRNSMNYFRFSGMFGLDPDSGVDGLVGSMDDFFGEAQLTDITLTDGQFSFTKRYVKRKDTIRYTFRKLPDGTWIGQYEGAATGVGIARCVVTSVPEDFLDPEKTLELAGKEKFHDWGTAASPRPRRR